MNLYCVANCENNNPKEDEGKFKKGWIFFSGYYIYKNSLQYLKFIESFTITSIPRCSSPLDHMPFSPFVTSLRFRFEISLILPGASNSESSINNLSCVICYHLLRILLETNNLLQISLWKSEWFNTIFIIDIKFFLAGWAIIPLN